MNFIDNEHKLFWAEKYKIIEKYGKVDVYYKSLIYTLGICEVTRRHFLEIFDIKEGEINIDCKNYSWQTLVKIKKRRKVYFFKLKLEVAIATSKLFYISILG